MNNISKKRLLLTVLIGSFCFSPMTVLPAKAEEALQRDTLFGVTLTEEQKELLQELGEDYKNGELKTEEQITEALKRVEEECDIDLSDAQEQAVVSAVKACEKLGLAPDMVLDKAEQLYETYGEEFVSEAQDKFQKTVVEPAVEAAVETAKRGFIQYLKEMLQAVLELFRKILNTWG